MHFSCTVESLEARSTFLQLLVACKDLNAYLFASFCLVFCLIEAPINRVTRELKQQRRRENENVISKCNFPYLWLFRDYSNLLNMGNAGELSRA